MIGVENACDGCSVFGDDTSQVHTVCTLTVNSCRIKNRKVRKSKRKVRRVDDIKMIKKKIQAKVKIIRAETSDL